MIDTKALRSRVLDLAIQGKLTEQLPSDGTAEELYQQIQAEKQALIKEGKIKKEKPLPEISADEIPFKIPSNWKWIKFSNIIVLQSGQDLTKDEYNDKSAGIPYMTGASNYNDDGSLIINRWTETPKALAENGDILLSCKGTVGKITILSIDKVHIARQIMGIRVFIADNSYVSLFVKSSVNGIIAASKGLIPGIERKDVLNLNIPLPPLAEQKRIVERVEEIFRLLDAIDEAQEKYSADAESLKAKLITAGIQGKLTEQLDSDGTAEELYQQIQAEKQKLIKEGKLKKEKPLPEIKPEEIPFEIPGNWKWVRLGNVGSWGAGATPSRREPLYYNNGDIAWLKTGDLTDGEINEVSEFITEKALSECSLRMNPVGSVLIAMYGATIGKLGVLNIPVTTNQACCACIPYSGLDNKYLFYFLLNERENFINKGHGGAQPNISKEIIINSIIPLPPLAEQKRIVEVLERVMGVIS